MKTDKLRRKKQRIPRELIRLLGFLASLCLLVFNFTDGMRAVRRLPAAIFLESPDGAPPEQAGVLSPFSAVTASSGSDEALGSRAQRLSFRLFGLIELASVPVYRSERVQLRTCGDAIGISIRCDGVLIVGFSEFYSRGGALCCPARECGLRAGDVILSVGDTEVSTSEELKLALSSCGESVSVEIIRDGKQRSHTLRPLPGDDGARIGAWVRDSTVGIGTLSFVSDGEARFASLGHAVLDADTGVMIPVLSGELSRAGILGVTKGRAGAPGELRGAFSSKSGVIGSVDTNSGFGVFGRMNALDELGGGFIPLSFPSEVHEGDAHIIAQVGPNGAEKYSCRIVRTVRQSAPEQKGLVVEVTDERLLAATGGIVQGMSGSPIVQDGRLAGVVTHVFVNDPTKGYGIYAFWMYEMLKGHNG